MEDNTVKNIKLDELSNFSAESTESLGCDLSLIQDLQVELEVKVGGASISVKELFELRKGSVVSIDKLVDEPVEILLNEKLIAHGQLVAVGEHLGIEVIEVE